MKISSLKVNSTLYDGGKWVDKSTFPAFEEMRFHVRAIDCRQARRVRSELLMALPVEERRNLSPQKADEIDAAILARGVLVDWAGLEDENGPVPFSPEKAEELLANPDFRVLKDYVSNAAAFVQVEASIDMESAAKN
jgi:hypothetical protein